MQMQLKYHAPKIVALCGALGMLAWCMVAMPWSFNIFCVGVVFAISSALLFKKYSTTQVKLFFQTGAISAVAACVLIGTPAFFTPLSVISFV